MRIRKLGRGEGFGGRGHPYLDMLNWDLEEQTRKNIHLQLWWEVQTGKFKFSRDKQRHYFANKGPPSQGYSFSSGHIWMWEVDCEESWVLKNWCIWTVVLEKTLESPLDCKDIQSVHPKGDKSWVFIGRIDAEAETPVLWLPHAKSWLIGKDPDAGRDWGQEEKGRTEDEMAGWHHRLDGHEFKWTSGVGDGQGGLACCDSWGRKESDIPERLNWAERYSCLENPLDRGARRLNWTETLVYEW